MQRALIYLRVSTDKQAEKGLSIPAQQERCLQYARENDFEVDLETDIYIDRGESARTANRPQFQVLWQRCRADETIRAVIFYDISRLARNRIDFALIKDDLSRRGIRICSATEGTDSSPSGQMLEGVLSSVAEFFSLQSGEKIKGGMEQKAKEGVWPSKAPYGYKNVQEKLTTGKVNSWIEVNWEEAKWTVRAFELFATGNYSIKDLAKTLVAEGFPMRMRKDSSGKLHASYLEKILRNQLYLGVIVWKRIANPNGKHELFLDRTLFEKAQAILDMRLGGGSRRRKHFSIAKSVTVCAECGSRHTVEEHTTSNGTLIRYSRCLKSQHSERVQCSQEYMHEEALLEQLDKIIKKIKLPQAFLIKLHARIRKLFASEQEIYEKARADILGKIEDVKRRKKNLVLQLIDKDRMAEGDLSVYENVKVELNEQEKHLSEQLEKIENKITTAVRTIEIACALAVGCHYAYKKARPELKAMLVQTFFQRIEVRDKQISRVVLNEPLGYLCHKRLAQNPIFDLSAIGGPYRIRTCDPLIANEVLYQLS